MSMVLEMENKGESAILALIDVDDQLRLGFISPPPAEADHDR